MNAIRNLFAAFANVAASLNKLAAVLDAGTGRLQQQLGLDEPPRVIEHHAVGDAAEILDSSNRTPASKRNGRKAA